MDSRYASSSKYAWNVGMELIEAADRLNVANQAVAICDLYKEALSKLMEGREEPVGPPAPEKLGIIRKYMQKAETIKQTLATDEFSQCVDAARRTITKAVNYDKGHHYPDALQMYKRGVDYFHRALRVARTEEERATLARNIRPYEKRLAKLQPLVEEGLRQAVLATYDEEEGNKPACWDDRLSRATALVSQAVKFDKKRNYVQALDLYTESITHFLAALRQGQAKITPKVERVIKEKVRQYMERAEAIKHYVDAEDAKILAKNPNQSYDNIAPNATDQSFADAIPEAPTTKPGLSNGKHRNGPYPFVNENDTDDELLRRFKELGKGDDL